MRKLHSLMLICASFTSLIISSEGYAGDRADTLSLTLGGGYDFFSTRRHVNDAGIGFFGLGYDFTNHWGIDGLVGFFQTRVDRPSLEKRKHGNIFLVDGVYNFLPSRLVEPFVMAGIGLTNFSSNLSDANNQGNANVGVGVKFFVDKVVSLRAEAREIYSLVGGKSDIFIDGGITFYLDCVKWNS